MDIVLYSNQIEAYVKCDNVIDYENEAVAELADELFQKAENELEFIRMAYEFVRDQISHSADSKEDSVIIYPDPDKKILEKLGKYRTRTELWNDLPTELAYSERRD